MVLSDQDVYNRISHLLENVPSKLTAYTDVLEWCTKADVLVEHLEVEAEDHCVADGIYSVQTGIRDSDLREINGGFIEIRTSLIRCLYRLEVKGGVQSDTSFIPAGNEFDALNAISQVFARANDEILVVDPYLDHVAFRDFLALSPKMTKICLLCSSKNMEQKIGASLKRWRSQNPDHDIEVRGQNPGAIHDRLIIIDKSIVYLVSQSLNGIAKRSHAYIVNADAELSKLKVTAYEALWAESSRFEG